MGSRVAGRRWRVALAAGLLVAFVGCSGGPTAEPIKVEQGKTAEESVQKGRPVRGAQKHDPGPIQRTAGRPG